MTDTIDNFALETRALSSPGGVHYQLVPSDSENLPRRPRVVVFETSGTAAIVDQSGTELTYTRDAGEILPFSPVRVMATGTTATLYGWE